MTNDERRTKSEARRPNKRCDGSRRSVAQVTRHSSFDMPSSFGFRPASLPIGLLAGSGRFPIVFAEKARTLGLPVVCVGIRHAAEPELAGVVQRFYWSAPARL